MSEAELEKKIWVLCINCKEMSRGLTKGEKESKSGDFKRNSYRKLRGSVTKGISWQNIPQYAYLAWN